MSRTVVDTWSYTHAGYPETLKFTTTSIPSTPSPHHVLLRIHAVSLNPVDVQLMNLVLNNLPYLNGAKTPGRDFSATVLAASEESGFKRDDEIMGISMSTTIGFLREVVHLDVRQAVLIKKPANLDWVKAASLPLVWLTAKTSVDRCIPFMKASNATQNKLAVLGGSSSTGIYTILLAKRYGWRVLATCSGRNVEFVKSLGADQVVDYTTSPDAVVNAIKDFAPSAIVDNVGGTECVGLAPQYVTIVGDKTSRSTMGGSLLYLTYPTMVFRWLMGRIGLGSSYECIILDPRKEWLEEIGTLQEDQVVIDSVFKFGQTMEAFEKMNTARCKGKVVVVIEEE